MNVEQIKSKISQLKELEEKMKGILLSKQDAIDQVLTEDIKEELSAIDDEFAPLIKAAKDKIASVEEEVKNAVLRHGSSVNGEYKAVYYNGRVSWDTKALDGFMVAYPELKELRKVGDPYVSIRKK